MTQQAPKWEAEMRSRKSEGLGIGWGLIPFLIPILCIVSCIRCVGDPVSTNRNGDPNDIPYLETHPLKSAMPDINRPASRPSPPSRP